VLFCLLIPHFNAHGKMNGDPGYLRAEVCPRIQYLTHNKIEIYLREIDIHTNVKWFQHDGLWYLHSLKWKEHQDLPEKKLGADILPSHPSVKVPDQSKTTPGVVPPELEVKREKEEEVEAAPRPQKAGASAPEVEDKVEFEVKRKKGKEIEMQTSALRAGASEAPPAAASTNTPPNSGNSQRKEALSRMKLDCATHEFRRGEIDVLGLKKKLYTFNFTPKEITEIVRKLSNTKSKHDGFQLSTGISCVAPLDEPSISE